MPHVSEFHALPHERHDPLLVAALAAGDLAGTDRDRAADLISTCGDCSILHDDLLAIARATAVLPAAVRPRDFRISPEQAARLRPAGWRRLIAALAGPRLALGKPLGLGLTTLGLAGLLVANVGSVLPYAASVAAPETILSTVGNALPAGGGSPAASAGSDTSGGEPGAETTSDPAVGMNGEPGASAAPVLAPVASDAAAPTDPSGRTTGQGTGAGDEGEDREVLMAEIDEPGPSTLTVVSIAAVLAGLAILVLRRIARRFAAS